MPALMKSTVVALGLVGSAFAVSAPHEEIVYQEQCQTASTGILQTAAGKQFTVNDGLFSFLGVSSPLHVEFQLCTPNFGGYNGPSTIGGHIYIASSNQCLNAEHAADGPPFTFGTADCALSDDSSQDPQQFIRDADGNIWFSGGTQADGSYEYFGDECPSGLYGASGSATSGTILLQCADLADTVGLRVVEPSDTA